MKTLDSFYKLQIRNSERMAGKPFDEKIFVEWYIWNDTADHSAGITKLGELELTAYLEYDQLQAITEEIENDIQGEAGYGTIIASQFNQELSEATEAGDNVAKGTLLREIRLEQDTPNYQYGLPGAPANDVHLWVLRIDRGNTQTANEYVTHRYILGWLYYTADTKPKWVGHNRPDSVSFTLTAQSLLAWLKDVSAAELGDCSNHSGVYYDDSEDEAGDNEYWQVMNYSLTDYLRQALNAAGVLDANIDLSIPPDDNVLGDYSTLNTLLDEDPATALEDDHKEMPAPFRWQYLNGIEYTVWFDGLESAFTGSPAHTARARLTKTNHSKGYSTHSWLNLVTGTDIAGSPVLHRIWHVGVSTNLDDGLFFSLIHDGTDYWVGKHQLSGTGTITNQATKLTVPANHIMHWMKVDIDTVSSPDRLWGILSHTVVGATFYYDSEIGYFTLSFTGSPPTSSWTEVLDTTVTGTHCMMCTTIPTLETTVIGGFRILNVGTGKFCAEFLMWLWDGHESEWQANYFCYDSQNTAGQEFRYGSYDLFGAAVADWIINHADMSYPIIGGRGTIGGFFDSDAFFCLPSIEGYVLGYPGGDDYAIHDAIVHQWSPGTDWADFTATSLATGEYHMFRSMPSHGTETDVTWVVGIISNTHKDPAEVHDYMNEFTLFHVRSVTGTPTLTCGVQFSMADGTESDKERQYPSISPPSLTCNHNQVDHSSYSLRDRYFVIRKQWGSDVDSSQVIGSFFMLYSDDVFSNFAYDFSSGGISMADFFKQVAQCYALIMNVDLWSTKIRPRNDTSAVDDIVALNEYEYESQRDTPLSSYAGVVLTCSQNSLEYKAGNTDSLDVLAITANFITPTRAQERATQLYNDWKYDQVIFTVNGTGLTWLEPADKVTFNKTDPLGETTSEVSGLIYRMTHKGLDAELEIKTVTSGGQKL